MNSQDNDDVCDRGIYDMFCSIYGKCEDPCEAQITKVTGCCTRLQNLYMPACGYRGNIYICKQGLFGSCADHQGKGRHVIISKDRLDKEAYVFYGEYSDYRQDNAMTRQTGWEYLFLDETEAKEDEQLSSYLQETK